MRYFSTRDVRHEWATTLDTALTAGLAADGGLYVPEKLPRFTVEDFNGCRNLPEVAERLLTPFFSGSSLAPKLGEICREALDLPVPLVPLRRPGETPNRTPSATDGSDAWLLELFHGPTAAFKDFAARFLAACLARLRTPDDSVRTVLVATSGDTGAAVAAAFHKRPGFRVVILYPQGRVAARQAHQLGAFGDNVHAFAVNGNFDDCQRMVKHALGDRKFANRQHLTSANSISLGRLLPQMAYYAYASLVLARRRGPEQAPPDVIVPTGNLGNALAAIMVRELGLPLGDIHLATNANATLAEYFAGAAYRGRPSVATLANAMDVGDPSNFERLTSIFNGRDLRHAHIHAQRVEDDDIRARIGEGIGKYWQVLCPHTACAVEVHERLLAGGNTNTHLLVATAHPAKFNDIVEPLVGNPVAVPAALDALLKRPAHAEPMEASDQALLARLERGFDD
jgi:threonine synthase